MTALAALRDVPESTWVAIGWWVLPVGTLVLAILWVLDRKSEE